MEEEKAELLLAWFQWHRHHHPKDFEVLHDALWPIVEKYVDRFPAHLKPKLQAHAIGVFLWALATWNSKGIPTLESWVAMSSRRIKRKAGQLLYPGVPEARWPRMAMKAAKP